MKKKKVLIHSNHCKAFTGFGKHTKNILIQRLRQTAGDEVFYLYPLLPKGDTLGREIHVLLRTTTKPDDLYGFEDRTFEGFARPPGNLVDRTVRDAMMKKGYHFTEDFVLVEEWVPEAPD